MDRPEPEGKGILQDDPDGQGKECPCEGRDYGFSGFRNGLLIGARKP
jgi:hypothetical protein